MKDAQSSIKPLPLASGTATSIRNYLATVLIIQNGLRPLSVISITVNDINKATLNSEYQGMSVIYNYQYKTATIYGEKYILISNHLYEQRLTYITEIWPYIAGSAAYNNLFTKGGPVPTLKLSSVGHVLCLVQEIKSFQRV